jgi:hypothetical protein
MRSLDNNFHAHKSWILSFEVAVVRRSVSAYIDRCICNDVMSGTEMGSEASHAVVGCVRLAAHVRRRRGTQCTAVRR